MESTSRDPKLENSPQLCGIPAILEREFDPEVSPFRARLIRGIEKKWVNGTKLRYYFFTDGPDGGDAAHQDIVRQAFRTWKSLGIGLEFEEVNEIGEAEIRIGFRRGDGAWSYVGRDVLEIPGQYERTMNFGWDLMRDPGGMDVALHEIGHTLGFFHEHQNPFAGIVWDEQAVYEYMSGPPNYWNDSMIYRNILQKFSTSTVEGSDWDKDSIMHYPFPPGLILSPERYRDNGLRPEPGLSEQDIEQVRLFYPPLPEESTFPKLEPFRSRELRLEPAEQINFLVEPDETRTYTFQTFGGSDTVAVLFEDLDNDKRYVDGDDDSGTSFNVRFQVRLYRERRYILRLRLYSKYASGETVIMMW